MVWGFVLAPVASKETTNAVNSANTVSEINGNNISDQTDKVLYDIRATKKIDYRWLAEPFFI